MIKRHTFNIPTILLGNSNDKELPPYDKSVTPYDIKNFMQEHNVDEYRTINLETGYNVGESFRILAELIIKKSRHSPTT